MRWLLRHLPLLREGCWPGSPKSTSYTEAPISKRVIKAKSYFQTSIEIIAEVAVRLEHCKLDGLLVEANYTWDKSIDSLVKLTDIDFYDVVRRISRALNYISSGTARRWHTTEKRDGISYAEWVVGKST